MTELQTSRVPLFIRRSILIVIWPLASVVTLRKILKNDERGLASQAKSIRLIWG